MKDIYQPAQFDKNEEKALLDLETTLQSETSKMVNGIIPVVPTEDGRYDTFHISLTGKSDAKVTNTTNHRNIILYDKPTLPNEDGMYK